MVLEFYKNQYNSCSEMDNLRFNDTKCEDNVIAYVTYNNNKWKLFNNYILKEDRLKNKTQLMINNDKEFKRIVIVLESPHKDEYDTENRSGYPALGATGRKLNKGIEELLNSKLSNTMDKNYNYEIILMNAIQFQASLGVDTNVFRDRIWLSLWLKDNMRAKFIERIKGYKPDIIINLCTKGCHKKDIVSNNIEITKIGERFIKSLNIDKLIMDNDTVFLNSKEVCIVERDAKNSNQGYTLRNFVNHAIYEAFSNDITVLRGQHPSSWRFNKNNLLKQSILNNIMELS